MTHSGGQDGYYPGTRSSANMLANDDTGWVLKPLIALDMPFTAVMDTLLLPWDMFHSDNSLRARVADSEEKDIATNAVIPPSS